MSFFKSKKSTNFWVDEHGKMTGYEPEREVLMSRSSNDSDTDDNDSVLFERNPVISVKGAGSYKTAAKSSVWWWVISLGFLLTALTVFVVLVYANYVPLLPGHLQKGKFNKTSEWTVLLREHGTESCVRLVDVDEDGRDDIIFAMFTTKYFRDVMSSNTIAKMKKLCSDSGAPYPCAGQIIALRGYDGKELWRTSLFMAPFELNCNNIDIDGDGKLDCIAAGRMGTAAAFNPRNGTILWNIDDGVIHRTWNFYNVLIMPDFTQDGVPEILLSHGGDPQFNAKVLRRLAGRLVLVNGRTGHSLGRFLNMSRYKETYMSPALHTTKDGSQYVLYGQGGETARGDLLGISVPDLYRYVKELPSSTPIPNTKGSYTGWKDKVRALKNGVFVIYRSDTRGVMVAPTLVDMNNDGIHDIMMSAYDGTIQLFDGETLEIMWTTKFPGFESYSTLAPAYFNDDDTLDFMLHMNKGSWPKYLYSQTLVLDGTNGEVLWRLNASQYEMTSDLVARTTEDYRDTFVFQVKGVNVPTTKPRNTRSHLHDVIKKRGLSDTPVIYNEGDANFTNLEKLFNKTDLSELESLGDTDSHSTGNDEGNEDGDDDPQDDPATVEQDGSDSDDDEHYPDCSEDMKTYTTYVFMLDRSNVHAPNVLLQLPSLKLHYNVTSVDQTVEVSRRRSIKARSAGSSCIILKNDERTTGVLGDVDGDGNMDMISIVDGEGEKKDGGGNHVGMSYSMRIVKTNLVDALNTRGRYLVKLDLFVAKKMRDIRGIKPIEKVLFRPLAEQPWTQYLGRRSDNIYPEQG